MRTVGHCACTSLDCLESPVSFVSGWLEYTPSQVCKLLLGFDPDSCSTFGSSLSEGNKTMCTEHRSPAKACHVHTLITVPARPSGGSGQGYWICITGRTVCCSSSASLLASGLGGSYKLVPPWALPGLLHGWPFCPTGLPLSVRLFSKPAPILLCRHIWQTISVNAPAFFESSAGKLFDSRYPCHNLGCNCAFSLGCITLGKIGILCIDNQHDGRNRAYDFGCDVLFVCRRCLDLVSIQSRFQAPKRHIGGSGMSACYLALDTYRNASADCVIRFLGILGRYTVAFFLTLLIVIQVALCKLWTSGLNVPQTLAGRFCRGVVAQVPSSLLLGLVVATPARPVLRWERRTVSRRTLRGHTSLLSQGARTLLSLNFLLGHLPICVWAAPKGVRELQAAGDFVAAARGAVPDEGRPEALGTPVWGMPDFVDPSMRAPRGPPPPTPAPITIENTVQHTQPAALVEVPFPVWVGSPGYQADRLQLRVGVPSDIEDATDVVARSILATSLPYCDRLVPVRPQPFPACGAYVRAPDWTAYSAMSLVCLDLRDMGPQGDGPVIAAFVTRPTCKAELCREAGAFGDMQANVYVGTDPTPLQEDESIVLASGCLVTFMKSDCRPFVACDLQFRLQFAEHWNIPARFPVQLDTRDALLLLHRTGRYMLRSRPSHLTADEAAARFVGVDRSTVAFHVPEAPGFTALQYKGSDVRGVAAITNHLQPGHIVVFLDLRQVAEGVKFMVLPRSTIYNHELPRMVARKPLPPWRLVVVGGRRRRDRLDVQHCATLIFGFQYTEPESDPSSPPFSPTTDADDDADEGGEEEDDSSANDSEATTRSRSRDRGPAHRTQPSPSSDPSYQGTVEGITFAFEGYKGWLGVPYGPPAQSEITFSERGSLALDRLARTIPDRGVAFTLGDNTACVQPLRSALRRVESLPKAVVDALLRWSRRPDCVLESTSGVPCFMQRVPEVWTHVYKLLTEPVCSTPAAQQALGDLRFLVTELGGDWPYVPSDARLFDIPEATNDGDSEEGIANRVCQAAFLVLTPEYVAERLFVEVTLPNTTSEVMPLLQQARQPYKRTRFPHLVPALPQHGHGFAIFVGLPHWDPAAIIVCLDLTAVDGRLYAAPAPAYADKATLCDIADLPLHSSLRVYVGVSQEPLEADALAHLIPGLTVVILPAATIPTAVLDVSQMLLHPRHWSPTVTWTAPAEEGAYCLVRGYRHRRFHADLRQPTQYRQQIAAAVGAEGRRVYTFPAIPRVEDAEIDGIACLTALAVAVHGTDADHSPQLILIDCRAMLEGWVSWPTSDGQVLLEEILQDLRFSAPLGFDVELSGIGPEEVHLAVQPGQVLIADFVPRPVLLDAIRPATDLGAEVADMHQEDALRFDLPTVEAAMHAWQEQISDRIYGSAPPAGGSPEPNLQLLIFVPDYLPELHELYLHFPITVDGLVQEVSCKRSGDHQRHFPFLNVVTPQPDSRFVTLVALPMWGAATRTVVIDARLLDGRLFAVQVPVRVNAASIITIADVSVPEQVQVYVGDVPWPLTADTQYEVIAGDLFTLLPVSATMPLRHNLAELLQRQDTWTTDDAFAGDYGDYVWLVTDSEPLLYEVQRHRREHFRADVAAAIGTDQHRLRLVPVQPLVQDFADHGRLVRHVLLALETPFPGAEDGADVVPFLLDLRPIFLGYVAAFAPGAMYDVADLLRRLRNFCPPGFVLVACAGTPLAYVEARPRHTRTGDVLTVEFVPQPIDVFPTTLADTTTGNEVPNDIEHSSTASTAHHGPTSTAANSGHTTNARWDATHHSSRSAVECSISLCLCAGICCLFASRLGHGLCLCLLGCAGSRRLWAPMCLGISLALQASEGVTIPPAETIPLDCSQTGPTSVSAAGRPLPTPCRALRAPCVASCRHHFASAMTAGDPCEGSLSANSWGQDPFHSLHSLQTLLEESAAASTHWAFLAATLLDTLEEHFAESTAEVTLPSPVQVCLEEALGTTTFQKQCLDLCELLPVPSGPGGPFVDWLDNDYLPLLAFPGATFETEDGSRQRAEMA